MDDCPSSPKQWLRGRVLSTNPSLQLLAVDYGFTVVVELAALRPLPSQCRGVPPQVSNQLCTYLNNPLFFLLPSVLLLDPSGWEWHGRDKAVGTCRVFAVESETLKASVSCTIHKQLDE